jgi:histidinol phosphatase-like enzyme (inositol monophosphatase family)
MTAAATDLLLATLELARLTGQTAVRHFRGAVTVEQKGDGSPVTIADREAERAARDWIARRFPDDAILGEEFGETPGASGRCWLLDPIDGTRTFVRGVPLWGSLVAVIEGDVVLAGAACYPALGEEIAAAPGRGCWHNGARCSVSKIDTLADAAVLTSEEIGFSEPAARRGWDRLSGASRTVRTWGDCYGYLLVATGRAEVMVDGRLNPWDAACFVPILQEAGGTMTDLAGRVSWNLHSGIATNAALAGVARACFAVSP